MFRRSLNINQSLSTEAVAGTHSASKSRRSEVRVTRDFNYTDSKDGKRLTNEKRKIYLCLILAQSSLKR